VTDFLQTSAFTDLNSGKALQFTDSWKEHFKRIDAPEEQQPDLRSYAGEFWSSELETWLRIHQRNGQLVLELYRQGEYPLRSVGRNIFVSASDKYPWFELKFQRDSKQAITGVRLNGILFGRRHLE
jgi:hypothetical protein